MRHLSEIVEAFAPQFPRLGGFIVLFAVSIARGASEASNTVADLTLLAKGPTDVVAWSNAVIEVTMINSSPWKRERNDFASSSLGGIRVFLTDATGALMPRTLAGSNVMLRTGELNQSEDSYRGSGSLLPGTTTRVDVVLSRFYQAPTAGVHAIQVTFDTDSLFPRKRIDVTTGPVDGARRAGRGLSNSADLLDQLDPPSPIERGYGPIISNIHVEVSCPGFKVSTNGP